MQNTMMQKSEFSKMRDCSGFLQIRSHINLNINIIENNLLETIHSYSTNCNSPLTVNTPELVLLDTTLVALHV